MKLTPKSEIKSPLSTNAGLKATNDTQNQTLMQILQKGTDFGELSYVTRNDNNSVTLKPGQLATQ